MLRDAFYIYSLIGHVVQPCILDAVIMNAFARHSSIQPFATIDSACVTHVYAFINSSVSILR